MYDNYTFFKHSKKKTFLQFRALKLEDPSTFLTDQSVVCYLTGKGREQAIFHLPFVEENHKIGIGQPNGFAFTIIMANILRFCQSSPISRCSVLEAYSESLISN